MKGAPAPSQEISEKDKIMRNILISLNEKGLSVSLLLNGEAAVSMPTADYTIKITKKKERIL